MTPAINLAKKLALTYRVHTYSHDSSTTSYGLEAVEKLGVAAENVFKTLVVCDEKDKLIVAIIPVEKTLNLKSIAQAVQAKKVHMADPKVVERTTGYVLGGVSPLGQKKRLTTVIDESALSLTEIYVSAGRRGLELSLPPQQLSDAVMATFAHIT